MPVYQQVSNISCEEVAISSSKFWCVVDEYTIDEYVFNPSASPFTFTPFFNQSITFTHSDYIDLSVAIKYADTLISIKGNVTPNELCSIDISTNPANITSLSPLPNNRKCAQGGILYVKTTDKVILCTQTLTGSTKYYISQYDLATNYIEVDYDITNLMSGSGFSTIFEVSTSGSYLFILLDNGNFGLIEYTTGVVSGPFLSPGTHPLNVLGSGQFEGPEKSNCVPYEFALGSAANKIYAFWVGDSTPETNLILYSDDSFSIGITLYEDSFLSSVYLGHSTIIYGLDVYTLTSGVVTSSTPYGGPYPTPSCSLSNYDVVNTLSTNVSVTIDDAFGNTQTIICPGNTTLNLCTCSTLDVSAPIATNGAGGSCPW